jgi:hypothetical protein
VIKIYTKKLSEQTAGFCDIIDLTAKVRAQVENGRPCSDLGSNSSCWISTIVHLQGKSSFN